MQLHITASTEAPGRTLERSLALMAGLRDGSMVSQHR
jgi:hypothetical protein